MANYDPIKLSKADLFSTFAFVILLFGCLGCLDTESANNESLHDLGDDETMESDGEPDPLSLFEFCDTLKPLSLEHAEQSYQVFDWNADEKRVVTEHIQFLHSRAPHLLSRGALDGPIRFYRASLANYAKGGQQLVVFDSKVFSSQGGSWARRVLIHELVHTADPFREISSSTHFRAVMEPRLKRAIALLAAEGLTPAEAAALPLGETRDGIEALILSETGLPSALAAMNLSECLAEVASFWIEGASNYQPPDDVMPLLREFLETPARRSRTIALFQAAQESFGRSDWNPAIKQLDECISAGPEFYQAYALRGHTYEQMGQRRIASANLVKCVEIISPLEHGYEFYAGERDRMLEALRD